MSETSPLVRNDVNSLPSGSVVRRRSDTGSLRQGFFGAIIGALIVIAGCAYYYAGDSGRWNAREYARAIREVEALREQCDAGLRQRRLGLAPAVSHALCVDEPAAPALPAHSSAMRFLVIGDWGRDGMCCQRDVALRMANVTRAWSPEFVMNVGDNFYNQGLHAARDEQFESSWANVYDLPGLRELDWITIAGNHDHYGNVSAQLEIPTRVSRWVMPDLQFMQRRGNVSFHYIDTTPMYYSRESLLSEFMSNFSNSESTVRAQLEQLEAELSESDAEWKLVIGHHPLFSTGEHYEGEPECLQRMQQQLMPIFSKYKIPTYFCGHEHSLEHAHVAGTHYFVSGAGSRVREITAHARENRFAIGRQGFMAVAIEKDEMFVYVIDMAGVVLHTAIIPRPV